MENSWIQRTFHLQENKTTVGREFIAGLTTFMTMAYILVVNPNILSDAGMDRGAVFVATIVGSVIATVLMGLLANYPFALAPGMGLNAFFAYTVVIEGGYSWQFALTAVLIEGLLFIVLSFFNVRELIIKSIPVTLKNAVSAGIGLFIAYIGLSSIGLIVKGEGVNTALGNLKEPLMWVAIFGLIFTSILLARNVKGAFLIGMMVTTLLGMGVGLVKPPSGFIDMPPSLKPTFMAFTQVDASKLFSFEMIIIVFTFLFVDLFDTVGCLVGLATKADMLDKKGDIPRAKQALLADAIGTTAGAMVGTSTVTTYIESASGISEGGRTGLTAIFTALFFVISLFFAPIFTAIPPQATAPVLILVGVMMMSSVLNIDFHDFTEAIPAFLTIIMMPLAYSIAEGVVFGVISYTILKLATGKRKDISITLAVLSILFILRLIFMT